MQFIYRLITSRIQNKIILPYVLLALCLAGVMSLLAARLTVGALQERLNNRLIEAGQSTSDELVLIEDQQIEQLRAMAFTQGVPDALAARDAVQLETLLRPHWASANLMTLIAFDTNGVPLLAWQRDPDAPAAAAPRPLDAADIATWWLTQQILQGHSDEQGDKFSNFQKTRLFTAAPVRRQGKLVGGIMIGIPFDAMLTRLTSRSQNSLITFYDSNGLAFATSQVVAQDGAVSNVPPDVLAQLHSGVPDQSHVQSLWTLNGREYQFAYSPLQLRRATNGIFSVALGRGFIIDAWANQRVPLLAVVLLMLAAIIGVGTLLGRSITRPLRELLVTARAVSGGELQRRSAVYSRDEVGMMALAFNHMTERLLHLYEASRNLAAHTQVEQVTEQTRAAVQRLTPDVHVLVVLQEGVGWRCTVAGGDPQLATLHGTRLDDRVAYALAQHSAPLLVAEHAETFGWLPGAWVACWPTPLVSNTELTGVILLLHTQPGMWSKSVTAAVQAVLDMAATAFHNAQLYRQLEQEGNRRQAILEGIADGVLVCDAERRVVLMNPAAATMLRTPDWQQHRYRVDDLPLVPLDDAPLLDDGVRAPTRYEAHGETLRASRALLPSAGGSFAGEVIVLRNVSAEAALDRAKTDLIAMISHELRTPLTAILGSVDMLARGIGGELAPLQRELADVARNQSVAMSALIDKAVLIANMETGNLEVQPMLTHITLVVEAAALHFTAHAQAMGVELATTIDHDLPPMLADARLLRFALNELIDNAIKYGGGTPVHVLVQRAGSGIEIAVCDDGPGIASEQIPHLFHRFARVYEQLNTGPRGLGLGLMLTRELVERQHGTVAVVSEPGKGARFSIILHEVSEVSHVATVA